MRTVKTRDSATTILRKLGVPSHDYNLYIEKTDAGFVVQETLARKSVVKDVVVDLLAKKDVVLTPAPPEAKPAPAAKQPKLSISGLAEQLLLAGKSNAETWAALKERFKLGDDKKHYPSWFRSRLRRQGRLPKKEKKS
jgi:hypothetical protein